MARVSKKASAALAALTQAALALPGTAAAVELNTGYLFSDYREQDIPGSRTASGKDQPRYDIQSHLFRLIAPVGEQTLGLNLTYETMSGASPWYATPDANGKPVQVMSGASIREERIAAKGTWALPLAGSKTAFSLGYSTENDYEAISGGAEVELNTPDNTLTWTGGIGYSSDTLEPTKGPSSPNVIDQADKTSVTLYGGAAKVLGEATVVQASLGYLYSDGFLSDPYKLAWVQDLSNTVPDARPDNRQAWVFNAKLRQYLEGTQSALAVDYRYYYDDWKINAHTLELTWHQPLPDDWRVSPSLRWYSQSRAYFYAPYYSAPRDDGLASSDYRLSPFGALSARVDVNKSIAKLNLGGGVEYYKADADFALKQVNVENPALVEYLSLQLRISYQF
jgi:hypothetical protein